MREKTKRFAYLAVWFVFGLLLNTAPLRAQSNLFLLVSSPGEPIGRGKTYATDNPIDVYVSGSTTLIYASALGFSAYFCGPSGASLTVGSYPNSARYPFNGSSPGLSVSGNGGGCDQECGSFQIHELQVDGGGKVSRLWITFTNRCHCSYPPMTGEVRYHSTLAPPTLIISQQPISQQVFSGHSVKVDVGAVGLAPLYYSWSLNGTNVAVTTNGQLLIPDIQSVHAGTYGVAVSNAYLSSTFSNFVVSVTNSAPVILSQPRNTRGYFGSNAVLSVQADGSQPISYQWRLNGNAIDDSTNATLALDHLTLSAEGNYDVVLSNRFGIVISSNAFLNVVDMAEALNATNLTWTTAGNVGWQIQPDLTYVGSARSGSIANGQRSILQTTVVGPGTLSFWWRVSSETNNDFLNFTVNGIEQKRISGLVEWNWVQETYYLTSGVYALAWTYAKNSTTNWGSDAGWLDTVSYVPGTTAAFVASGPTDHVAPLYGNAVFSVVARGTPPIRYQWHFNDIPLPGATNSSLMLTNVQPLNTGLYSVYVSNDYGGSWSTNAHLYLANIYAWGAGKDTTYPRPDLGQSIMPTNRADITAVAGGGYHSLALRSNGRVIAWGDNGCSQASVPQELYNACAISAGLDHSVALRKNGTPIGWGSYLYNLYFIPPATTTNLAAVAAGWYHNLALTSNGTVLAWGAGLDQSSSPHLGQCKVPTNLIDVAAIAAGGYHSLALRSDGTVVAWGWNAFGQTNVPPGLTNVIAIAAGASNSLALKSDRTLVAWGANGYGQASVPVGLSNVVAIAAGAAHNLALRSDGTLVAWGLNDNNQATIPVSLTNVTAIAAGAYHNLALVNVGPVTFLARPFAQTVFQGNDTMLSLPCLGTAPLFYQWLKEGAPVSGGTNATLSITNASHSDAGNYQVAVSNIFGVVTSVVVQLTVNGTAPYFTRQPTDSVVVQKGSTVFTAAAVGLSPLTYQWLFNGSPVPGATNVFLTVSNAQLTDEGFFSLMASNALGVTVSSDAYLNVIDLPDALGLTNVGWNNQYELAWSAQTTNTRDGFAAAVGPIAYGSRAGLQTTVTGPGTLTFWWGATKASLLWFNLQVDDAIAVHFPSTFSSHWEQRTVYLGLGPHILNWTVRHSSSFDNPVVFLDKVTLTPGTTPVSFTSQPASQTNTASQSVTFNVGATGTPPIDYQWFFNGTPLPGATGPSLTVANIQAANAGIYNVVASNANGQVTSSNATLVVVPSAPAFTTQPTGGSRLLGNSITFTGTSIGTSPITYQWLFNGQPIPGATNASLTLSNVQYAHAGTYGLVASNSAGTTASSNALLTVYSVDELGATLDNPGITWSTTNVPWFPQTNTTHDGVSAAQSGVISGSQRSTLQGTAVGPATVTYWWKVNCDSFWMQLAFALNGTALNSIAGNVDWQRATNYLGAGTNLLEWSLAPTHHFFAGGTGWVDQVQITPGGTAVSITSQPSSSTKIAGTTATLAVGAIGTPPLRYQWQFNGADLPGTTNASLVLTNLQAMHAGVYGVVVTNDYGYAASANAYLAVTPSAPVITSQPQEQTRLVNSSVTLSVAARGSSPLFYQWFINGAPIPGANDNTLVFTSVQLTNSGYYSAVVSNSLGVTSTTNAYLDVAPVMAQEFWSSEGKLYSAPLRVGDLTAVAAGATHTVALRPDGSVIAWGQNGYGQTNVPPGLDNVISIAAGYYHSLALRADGTVTAWGANTYGQTNLPAGLSNVVAIAAGPYHSLALKSDGAVSGWGNNDYGQIEVPLSLTNAQAIAAGYYHSFAVRTDGSVVQWGHGPAWVHNGTNMLLAVAPETMNIRSIAGGGFSGWSLQHDGTVLSWGWSEGTGPFTNSYSSASGGLTWQYETVRGQDTYLNIAAIVAGSGDHPNYDYALLLGNNGNASRVGFASYTPSIGLLKNVVAMAASWKHATLLVNDGSPRVAQNPLDRIAHAGDTVTLMSGIVAPAAAYQWQCNGVDIAEATHPVLTLTNIPLSASGLYRCLATNSLGAATNRAARLTVLRSSPRLNPASLLFTNGGFAWQLDRLAGEGAIVIESSSNLSDWTPMLTNPPQAGSLPFIDLTAPNHPVRFYRAVEH